MITSDDFKLMMLQIMEAGSFSIAHLDLCPWPQHVKDEIKSHDHKVMVIGLTKGLMIYKLNDFNLQALPLEQIGELMDDLVDSTLRVYASELSAFKDDTLDQLELSTVISLCIAKAFKMEQVNILLKLNQINKLIFG